MSSDMDWPGMFQRCQINDTCGRFVLKRFTDRIACGALAV